MTEPTGTSEFEKLRTLLSLKRHEVPPPGYFETFSSKVIARIEADALAEPAGWWERLLRRFDAKPVLAGAYSVAIGGLLVVGMGLLQVLGRDQTANLPLGGSWLATIPSLPPSPAHPATSLDSANGDFSTSPTSSMDPVWSSGAPSFLMNGAGLSVEKVGFRLQHH